MRLYLYYIQFCGKIQLFFRFVSAFGKFGGIKFLDFCNRDQFMPGNLAKEVYQKRCGELIQEAGQLNGMTAGGLMMPIRMRLKTPKMMMPGHTSR